MPRRPLATLLSCLVFLMLLSCSSGPRKQVFAPNASIQQLHLQADGSWQLQLRIQSFSNVPHTVARLEARLWVEGEDAGPIEVTPGFAIGPHNAEVETLRFVPTAGAAERARSASEAGRSLVYRLQGTLHSTDPDRRRDPLDFEGRLWPAPGLDGVFR